MEVQNLPWETETKSMQFLFLLVSIFIFSAIGSVSSAQVDTSNVLLKGGSSSKPDEGLDSGRYQIRQDTQPLPPPKKHVHKFSKKKTEKADRKISSEEKNKISKANETAIETTPVAAVVPSYADQVKDLVSGNLQNIEAYKEQIHPDDIRLNRLEFLILPGLLYCESKSNYTYRSYQSYSPYAAVGAEIWWTPFLGLYGRYGTSVGADVAENSATMSRALVSHEMIESGLDFRTFFGLSRRSNSITFGIHYLEYKFSPPGDNTYRTKAKSAGVGIHFQARFPVAPSYAWTLGAKMEPRVGHSEYGTPLGLQSGENPESSRFELVAGGEFKLSRQHQLIWTLSTALEKNQFSGPANLVDPSTGVSPSGVSVTQALSMFTLGYRWGH